MLKLKKNPNGGQNEQIQNGQGAPTMNNGQGVVYGFFFYANN